jgi:hypothetical protein
MDGVKRRITGSGSAGTGSGMGGFEALRSMLEKKQFRIPCVDVLVRL